MNPNGKFAIKQFFSFSAIIFLAGSTLTSLDFNEHMKKMLLLWYLFFTAVIAFSLLYIFIFQKTDLFQSPKKNKDKNEEKNKKKEVKKVPWLEQKRVIIILFFGFIGTAVSYYEYKGAFPFLFLIFIIIPLFHLYIDFIYDEALLQTRSKNEIKQQNIAAFASAIHMLIMFICFFVVDKSIDRFEIKLDDNTTVNFRKKSSITEIQNAVSGKIFNCECDDEYNRVCAWVGRKKIAFTFSEAKLDQIEDISNKLRERKCIKSFHSVKGSNSLD